MTHTRNYSTPPSEKSAAKLQDYCPKQYRNLNGIGVCTYPCCERCTLIQPTKKEKKNDTEAKK